MGAAEVHIMIATEGKTLSEYLKEDTQMALSNLFGWSKKNAMAPASACGASDKPAACGGGDKPAACGASYKPEENPAACGG